MVKYLWLFPVWLLLYSCQGKVSSISDEDIKPNIMATCLDVADLEYPEMWKGQRIVPLKGKSLVPVFQDRQRKGYDALFWEHEGNRAVRMGDWKLVSKYPDERWELYDLSSDRVEIIDLSVRFPEKVDTLNKAFESWAKRSGVVPWKEFASK
jgi:arylsulfatase A-like enzyme